MAASGKESVITTPGFRLYFIKVKLDARFFVMHYLFILKSVGLKQIY